MVRLLEKEQFKRCLLVVDGDLTWRVSLVWGQVNRLGVGGNYVCYLVIVVIFMGYGGAKRGFKVIVWREAEGGSHKVKVGEQFL